MDTEIEDRLFRIVKENCNENLRTFIFAIQKTADIIEKIGEMDYEEGFYQCLLLGVIDFSVQIKGGEFPKWEGDEYLSTKNGSNDMPLMRFAYDYIRWQNFSLDLINYTYKAYKEFRFFDTYADHYFAHTYSIEDEVIKKKYEDFVKKLSESMSYEDTKNTFTYNPAELGKLYTEVCLNTHKYIYGHQFISRYNPQKLVEMLVNSSASQISNFRGILFAVYRDFVGDKFDEKDVETLRTLLELVENQRNGEHHWDKIQLLQINWLCLNLRQLIEQME